MYGGLPYPRQGVMRVVWRTLSPQTPFNPSHGMPVYRDVCLPCDCARCPFEATIGLVLGPKIDCASIVRSRVSLI
jgi:hypothetical protein